MTYTPGLRDAAVDFYRVVHCSLGEDGLDDINSKMFLGKALQVLDSCQESLDPDLARSVSESLNKGLDENLPLPQRQEHLLLVSSLLK